jgi:hypothetical protein
LTTAFGEAVSTSARSPMRSAMVAKVCPLVCHRRDPALIRQVSHLGVAGRR